MAQNNSANEAKGFYKLSWLQRIGFGSILGWMKHKLETSLLKEISITSYMQMTPPLWQKVKRS